MKFLIGMVVGAMLLAVGYNVFCSFRDHAKRAEERMAKRQPIGLKEPAKPYWWWTKFGDPDWLVDDDKHHGCPPPARKWSKKDDDELQLYMGYLCDKYDLGRWAKSQPQQEPEPECRRWRFVVSRVEKP